MKNRQSILLIAVTGLFLSFCLGFLAGRATQRSTVSLSSDSRITLAEASHSANETHAPAPSLPVISEPAETASAPQNTAETTAASAETEAPHKSKLININTATASELDSLPGIGEVLAQRIVDYREANGPFTSVSQVTLVEGIGSKRLAEILDLITVE